MIITSNVRMSNLQQPSPYCPRLNHMGSLSSTTSIKLGLTNLAYQDQLFFPQMDCAHLLTLVQAKTSSSISLGLNYITKPILTFAVSHLLNLHVPLGSSTISPIAFFNLPNSAWTVQFRVAPLAGFSNRFTPSLPSSTTPTAKSSYQISLPLLRPPFRHLSMVLSECIYHLMTARFGHMQTTFCVSNYLTWSTTPGKSAKTC